MAITADFSDVGGVNDYDPIPALHAGSFSVKSAYYSGIYSTADFADHYTYTQLALCGIPGSDLPVGSRWLVFFNCAGGNSTAGFSVRVHCIQGTNVSNRKLSATQHTAHGGTDSMDGGSCNGFVDLVSDGGPIQFILHNISGGTAYWGGMNIVAVPLPTDVLLPTNALIENTDYWSASQPTYNTDADNVDGNLSVLLEAGSTPGYFDLLTKVVTAPETDKYVVLAMTSARTNTSGNGFTEARLEENGVILGQTMQHQFTNSNNRRPYVWLKERSYTKNQVVTLTLRGKESVSGLSGSAGALRTYNQPRIFVFRSKAFYAYASGAGSSSIATTLPNTYPGYNTTLTVPFTPYRTEEAEHALILSNIVCARTNTGAQASRTKDNWSTEPMGDFTGSGNTQTNVNDRDSLFSFAAPLVNFERDFIQETTPKGGESAGLTVGDAAMVVIGLTKNPALIGGPTLYTLNIKMNNPGQGSNSGVGNEVNGGGTDFPKLIHETSTATENFTYSVTPDQGFNIPSTHPRLWFNGNDRKAYLQSRKAANAAQWTEWVNVSGNISSRGTDTGNPDYPESWERVLLWMTTGLDSDLTKVRNSMTDMLGSSLDELMGQADGLEVRFTQRRAAIYLDWLSGKFYSDGVTPAITATEQAKLRNLLLITTGLVYNYGAYSAIWPGKNPDWKAAGRSSTYNNHYNAKMLGACYAALALYGEQPATMTWPYNTGTVYQFSLVFNNVTYTNLWDWFKAKLDGELMLTLDSEFPGGMLEEGTRYGMASLKHNAEMWCLLHQTANLNYVASHPTLQNALKTVLYIQQPGNKQMINFGDQSTPSNGAYVEAQQRLIILFWSEFAPGIWYEYSQYWINTVYTNFNGDSEYDGYNFMCYRHDRPATNWAGNIDKAYRALGTGFSNSRSDWTDNAICVNLMGRHRFEEHGHCDIGDLQIYRGPFDPDKLNSWQLMDAANVTFGNGSWPLSNHNCYYIENPANPTGWQQYRVGDAPLGSDPPRPTQDRFYNGNPTYVYMRTEGNTAYWTTGLPNTSGVRGDLVQLADIFHREVIHVLPGYVIVYDRMRALGATSSWYATLNWHNINNTAGVPAPYSIVDNNGRRRFRITSYSNVVPTYARIQNTDLGFSSGWREQQKFPLGLGWLQHATVFHCTVTTTPTMVSTESPPASIYNLDDWNYRAVSIKEGAVWKHFVFSAAQDGSAPTIPAYYVTKLNDNDQHVIVNLKPGMYYLVTQSPGITAGGYTKYTLAESLIPVKYSANSQGVLEFTPSGLGSQTITATPLLIVDPTSTHFTGGEFSFVAFSDFVRVRTITSPGTTESSDGSTFQRIPAGVTGVSVNIKMVGPSPGSASTVTKKVIKVIKSGGSGSSSAGSSFIKSSIYADAGVKAEKIIQPPKPFIWPNGDLAAFYVTPSPNDAQHWSKMRDENDDTYSTFNDAAHMAGAVLEFSLDDLQGFYDRVNTIRFIMRVREFSGAAINPVLVVKLLQPNKVPIAQYNYPLFTWPGSPSVTLLSPSFNINVSSADFAGCSLKLEPRATSYGGNYTLRMAAAGLEVLSAQNREKVIQ